MNRPTLKLKGIAMAAAGAGLWGLSGAVAQKLFEHYGFTAEWLVTVRMIFSGILLLGIGVCQKEKAHIWNIWRAKRDRLQLLIFSFIGMLGVQYTFFAAIQEGNAATATLLQFMGPLFITIYVSIQMRRLPTGKEISAVGLAMMGTFFLVTNGSFHSLSISKLAVGWGLASGITAAFYTLYASDLLHRWGSTTIVGWAMLIGGLCLSIAYPPLLTSAQHWTILSISYVLFVLVFGTLIAFYLFLDSLRYITATEVSLLSSAEPFIATITSVLWLKVSLGIWQSIGGICIIATIMMLSVKSKSKLNKQLSQ